MGFIDTLEDAVKTLAPLMGEKQFSVDTLISDKDAKEYEQILEKIPSECKTILNAGRCVAVHLMTEYFTPLIQGIGVLSFLIFANSGLGDSRAVSDARRKMEHYASLQEVGAYYAGRIVHDEHCKTPLTRPFDIAALLKKTTENMVLGIEQEPDEMLYEGTLLESFKEDLGYLLYKHFGKARFREYAHSTPKHIEAMLKEAVKLEFDTN